MTDEQLATAESVLSKPSIPWPVLHKIALMLLAEVKRLRK